MSTGDRPRRPADDEDDALWERVTRSIKPLKRHRPAPPAAAPKPQAKPPRPSPPPPAPVPHVRPAGGPALAPLERRERQRLARGTRSIDRRLDLHGRTQSEAHAALIRFLHSAQADGARTVLVITGKGGPAGEGSGERGVLRRQVPLWLSLPEFRALVSGFSSASVGHGGEGAFYVRVRRAR